MVDLHEARSTPTASKRRVLFIGEAVTLAHVVRPFVLAQSLDRNLYDVTFACDARYNKLLGEMPFRWRPIRSIPSETFLRNLAAGRPLFDAATLRGYVEEELALLQECKPDLVVGDMRLSLAVSAPLTKTCYMAICNAYWSPYAQLRFPVPEVPLIRYTGVRIAQAVFSLVRPLAFAYHAWPLNRVRREYGLPRIGLDPRRVHTWADYTLYPDVPELVPTYDLPKNHSYIGPILWSPAVDPPSWWQKLPTDRPIVYVTLGSSGESSLLHVVLEALAEMPVTVIAATAGRISMDNLPDNAFVADYLRGEAAAARARLVICNGGSPTTQQALTAGKPVLGLPCNMDQFMNMEAVQRSGSGEYLRASRADVAAIRHAVDRILSNTSYFAAAANLSTVLSRYCAPAKFQSLIARLLSEEPDSGNQYAMRGPIHDRAEKKSSLHY